ncbi:MAG: hypothetical protein IJX55_10625 [Clostridia bacterium]|nr:hypothetical protein [Clostridia bacterium]
MHANCPVSLPLKAMNKRKKTLLFSSAFNGARNVEALRKCPERTFLATEFAGYARKLSRFSTIRGKIKFRILIKALFMNKKRD